MFNFFRAKETETESQAKERIYVETHEIFSKLGIIKTLAQAQLIALTEEDVSEDERNQLIMGAYANLFIAGGFAKQLMLMEEFSETVAEQVANNVFNDSAFKSIISEVRISVPHTVAFPELIILDAVGTLMKAGGDMATMVRNNEYDSAFELWSKALRYGCTAHLRK